MKEYSIKVTHHPEDPSAWTVTLYQRKFLFKKKMETKWFNSELSATQHVSQLNYKYNIRDS